MKDTRKRSPWYSYKMLPATYGAYERRCKVRPDWGIWVDRFEGQRDWMPCHHCQWRGLAEKPE